MVGHLQSDQGIRRSRPQGREGMRCAATQSERARRPCLRTTDERRFQEDHIRFQRRPMSHLSKLNRQETLARTQSKSRGGSFAAPRVDELFPVHGRAHDAAHALTMNRTICRAKSSARTSVGREPQLPAPRGQAEGDHLFAVASQENIAGQDWVVPSLARDRRKPSEFFELVGCGRG
jgi:hypothetical protein